MRFIHKVRYFVMTQILSDFLIQTTVFYIMKPIICVSSNKNNLTCILKESISFFYKLIYQIKIPYFKVKLFKSNIFKLSFLFSQEILIT